MLDLDGTCALLAAVVDQARRDAQRNDRDAVIFLNAINAPETIEGQRKRRVAPYKRRKKVRRNVRN